MPLLALLSDVFGASHVRALARAHVTTRAVATIGIGSRTWRNRLASRAIWTGLRLWLRRAQAVGRQKP
jgi:hypothetical protein